MSAVISDSYGDNTTRKETFSHLIQVLHPRDGEDEVLLGQLLAKHPIQEKKLLEAAMYAPQWMEIVAKYLGWEGLRSAAWYFHADINERFTAGKRNDRGSLFALPSHHRTLTKERLISPGSRKHMKP